MKVRIHQPAQQSMQRGHSGAGLWLIEHEPASRRYPEPLMGWTASGDTLNQVKLNFATLEEAKQFAEKKGWEYSGRARAQAQGAETQLYRQFQDPRRPRDGVLSLAQTTP